MSTRYYDLIGANDRAVRLLHQGAYGRAIHTLENALQVLRVVAADSASASASAAVATPSVEGNGADRIQPTPHQEDCEEERQQLQLQRSHRHGQVGDLHILASPHKCKLWSDRCPDGVFSFCSQPMILAGTQEQVVSSAHNQNRAAAALMYNLSLAYQGVFGTPAPQARAPKSGFFPGASPASSPSSSSSSSPSLAAPGDRILACSLKICAMAVDLVSRLPATVTTHGDSVLYVSALNNQGFLHVYFSNRAEANRSMSMLECFFATRGRNDDFDYEYDFEYEGETDRQARDGSRPLSDRDAYKSAVNDVVYSVLLCQGRTVLDAAPAA